MSLVTKEPTLTPKASVTLETNKIKSMEAVVVEMILFRNLCQ